MGPAVDDPTPAVVTVPSTPATVSATWPASVQLLERYVGWLADAGTVRGLIGPREVDRLWERHILNCAVIEPALPADARVVDIGTGAGLPGIVLACVRSDLHIDLVEPLLRRTTFLNEVVADLGLGSRVRVVRGRAEDREVRTTVGSAVAVVARAVAPMARLAGWALPLLTVGGSLIAMKGESAAAEIAAHGAEIARSGGRVVGVQTFGVGLVDPLTTTVTVRRVR